MNEQTLQAAQGQAPSNSLPPAFACLEPYVAEWSIETERERARKRISTSMDELRAFQAALLPHLEPMIVFFNTLPNDPAALPADAKRLYHLVHMLMEASAPIDLQWETPDIDDAFPLDRMRFHPPSV